MSRADEFIDPWAAADKGLCFEGSVSVTSLQRVVEMLSGEQGDVRYSLRFYRDGRKARVEGFVDSVLKVTCQRCLRPMEIRIDETISLNLVQGLDEAERLSDGHDPLLVGNDGVKPLDLVEDELLLAIPHVPRHANEEDCDVEAWRSQQIPLQSQDQEVDVETENPFSELARLKEQLH